MQCRYFYCYSKLSLSQNQNKYIVKSFDWNNKINNNINDPNNNNKPFEFKWNINNNNCLNTNNNDIKNNNIKFKWNFESFKYLIKVMYIILVTYIMNKHIFINQLC